MKSDALLVAEALKGSEEAYSLLINRHTGTLHSFIRRKSKFLNAVVEELVQETFIDMYNGLHTYDASKPFITWLLAISKKVMFNHKEIKEDFMYDEAVIEEEEEVTEETPEEVLMSKQKVEKHIADVDDLPKKQRTYYTMRNFNGMSVSDIAAIYRENPRTVSRTLNRAKTTLRRKYDE